MYFKALVFMMALAPGVVAGQQYPNRPVRIVVGAAGGGSDLIARMIAQGIAGPLGQPVIVDNRGGGVVPAEVSARAQPDGYTLFVAGGNVWITPLLQQTSYDAVKDFSPVTTITREILMLAVHPSVPASSVKELISLAKAKPAGLNYAGSSNGSSPHLAMELFKHMAEVNIVRIPYKGSGPSLQALMGGEAQIIITDVGLVAPQAKAGKLKALGVTSAAPTALAPGMATVASGLPGYEAVSLTGLLAPANTPRAAIATINREVDRLLNLPDVRERLLNSGAEAVGGGPEQLAAAIKTDIAKLGKVIKDAGIGTN